ncbi:monovalent cation:proton antiporter-2 (CPA2) family protein [Glaciecola sp. 2405UD65-10]|uniref:monovalent cation:proton antiporter-2 (CPA2) family protein n=1 Tax=Glaciecola sp. 2405UD65-10 TaxID=3397244 RepID=UPI003B58F156
MEHFLLQLFIFLAAGAVAVPIAKKLGLGSVLGYLIAGIIVGPFGASLINNIDDIMHFTEFGVVMMLFLVGLELKPSMLWKMKGPILGTGGVQVFASSFIIFAIAVFFLPWQQALAIGLILALSSTAIVLQTLQEKGLMGSVAGRSIFSVLLFQDLAVIPMLAGIPLLATLSIDSGASHHSALFDIHSLPGYLQVIATAASIGLIFVLGKYVCGPMFRAIAATGVREIFVGSALALVVGASVLMLLVGLSPALGAFLAGVMLADSEFRHELESDIEPFKGLLLGIFFISIGASLNFTLIGDKVILIIGLALALIAVKWLVLFALGFKVFTDKKNRAFFAVALAQGGEFAFVLFQVTKTNGVLPTSVIEPLISAVAISMFIAPILFVLHDKLSKSEAQNEDAQADADDVKDEGRVILAGFGRMGIDIGRLLISGGIKPVILDHDAANVSTLRKLGFEVYFGDVTRIDLLESAGAHKAEVLVIAIGDKERSLLLIETIKKHFPHLKIISNAKDRKAAFELMDAGVDKVHRETFGTALELGQDALIELGTTAYDAHRLSRMFRHKEVDLMPKLHAIRNDEHDYIATYQKHNEQLENLLTLDKTEESSSIDKSWTAMNPEK